MLKVQTHPDNRLSQGDVLRDVEFIEYATEEAGIIAVSKIVFPLIIVLTQDCDLEQDYRFRRPAAAKTQDKWLLSVLVAPIYNLEHVLSGRHLSELKLQMQPIDRKSTYGKLLLSNQIARYHYLDFPEGVAIVPSVIDFKHYFSANVRYLHGLKPSNFVCMVSALYREDISHRFAAFLSRIGLPEAPNQDLQP